MGYVESTSLGRNVNVTELEAVRAREDANGVKYTDLKERLDNDQKNLESVFSNLAETVFYDEITFEKLRDATSNTDYYLTTIPYLDKDGNIIKLQHGFSKDQFNTGQGESARDFATRNITSFAANASTFDMTTLQPRGMQIKDGVVMQENVNNPYNRHILGIKDDNTLISYPPTTPSSQLLDDGVVHALTGFYPMIINGAAVDPSVYNSESNTIQPNPRQAIAQLPNKDIIFLTCEGRTSKNTGMTYDDMIRILLAKGATFAYCLDGGGSSQTLIRGVMLNNPIDDNGKTERPVPDFLYVKKPAINPQKLKTTSADIGLVNKRIKDIAADLLAMGDLASTVTWITDCNNASMASGFYWAGSSAANRPTSDVSWGILHFNAGTNAAMQIAFPYSATLYNVKMRRTLTDGSGNWYAWRDLKDSNIGTLTYNGDGTSTSKTIPHGLGAIPNFFSVVPASVAAGTAGIKYVTADATNLTVYFNAAPAAGTNNVVLKWKAEI
ncbi:phosphodiester glycosidase family protein [Fictibacillus gelatini]|uniref:phosphodiester glycosidase family protein n=1 Tax=Fictibacillus gelatini TaxID=225985 RepID=UPI000412A921|nr:phosphodiester glycosidase family protein [Fictibacillus gelatini]